MSIVCSIHHLNEQLRKIILQELHVEKVSPKSKNPRMNYGGGYGNMQEKKEVITYRINGKNDDEVYIPFYFARTVLELPKPVRKDYIEHNISFQGELRPKQKEIRKDAIQQLNTTGTCLLALHVGFGKSVVAIELACKIKLRTIIIAHRVVLVDQWVEYLKKYCSEDVSIGTYSSFEEEACDFMVMSALNIPKIPRHILKEFGFVIVDECHLISTEYFSKSLQYITPKYLVGLSATPYRNDGMDKIMDLYFGTERIVRKLMIEHTVYKIQTSFVPPVLQMRNGQLDWGRIIESQSNHVQRNEMILQIIQMFPDRHFLVLCKRKEQGYYLLKRLLEMGEKATRLMGNDRKFDNNARILVATINKAGVGFSYDILDTLILAADVEEYYIQYVGRITRRPDVNPLIFDIIDDNPTLQRHFATRKKVYKEIGGNIIDFRKAFPNFHIV